jgi:hypothetical protein
VFTHVVVVHQYIQYVVVLWLGCRCCRQLVNTICGRIMIGLSLSSVSKHNMWSCYDWVVVVVFRLWPHIVFTDIRQQWQPNDNTTTYCVYWRTTTTINPIIIRPHCMFTDRRQRFRILARKIEFGVFRLFRMRKKIFSWKNRGFWWISISFPHIIRKSVRNCPPNSIFRANIRNLLLRVMMLMILCLLTDEKNDNPIIIRPHIMFSDGRQQQ